MIRLLVSALLALTAANVLADNMYIYKDKGGEALLTNVNPSGNFDKLNKKVKTTYYKDNQAYRNSKSNKKPTNSENQEVSYSTSPNSNSASYADSAYLALR